MRSQWLRPKFWRRPENGSHAPGNSAPEAPAVIASTGQNSGVPQDDLMPCEDIYHAAGILSPTSGYGIDKVLQMLNSDHIGALPKEVKRASVLMALDAAGATPDEVLRDATQRQQALDSYETTRRKQFEEFELRKAQENSRIQTEMEHVTARYLDRIKQNLDHVAREKNALRNWQVMKQQENQRIAEVIGLCTKQNTSANVSEPPRAGAGPTLRVGPA